MKTFKITSKKEAVAAFNELLQSKDVRDTYSFFTQAKGDISDKIEKLYETANETTSLNTYQIVLLIFLNYQADSEELYEQLLAKSTDLYYEQTDDGLIPHTYVRDTDLIDRTNALKYSLVPSLLPQGKVTMCDIDQAIQESKNRIKSMLSLYKSTDTRYELIYNFINKLI